MIPRKYGNVGKPILFKGFAYDFGHAISGIEFSLDDGKNWTRYETPNTCDYRNVSWRFEYVPQTKGFYILKARSVNDRGRVSPEADFAELVVD